MKKSTIAVQLVKNSCLGINFGSSKFTIMTQCSNILDLVRLKAILIRLNNSILCKKKEPDYP